MKRCKPATEQERLQAPKNPVLLRNSAYYPAPNEHGNRAERRAFERELKRRGHTS